jgi:transposase
MDIISAYRRAGSYRGAAVICGATHKTVKRVVERAEAGDARPERKDRARNYAPVAELVRARVEASAGRISAKRLLPIAAAAGFTGSARNFRRLVAAVKADYRREHHRGRRPGVWAPGEYLVVDWADLGNGLHLFAAVLAWSRWRFVRFATDQQAPTTMALIADAMAAAGGVAGKVLTDRMGCLKGGVVANVVVPTPAYVRFAAHYGFAPDWCHAADPASKGVVENLVGYAQRDLAVPLLAEVRLAGRALSVGQANAAAVAWCAQVNASVHSQTCAIPDVRLAEEAKLFKALPSLRLQVGPEPVTRKVDRLSCVRFASARYSVPTRLIGTSVIVAQDAGRLQVIEPGTGQVVAEHGLVAPGEASVDDAHYGGPRPAPGRGPRPRTVAEQLFCGLGPAAQAFLVGAAAAGNTHLHTDIDTLLELHAAHGDEPLLAALHRAVAFKRWHAADVRSILANTAAGTAAPTPRGPGQALVLDLPTLTPRSLNDYAITAGDPDPDLNDTDPGDPGEPGEPGAGAAVIDLRQVTR